MTDFEADPASQARRISDDVAALKDDVASLVRQMKTMAGQYGQTAADSLSDQAADVYEAVAEKGRRGASSVAAHIEEKPITSLLVAFAAGFVFSKILSR